MGQGLAEHVRDARENGAFVDDGYAKNHDLELGSPVEVTFVSGAKKSFVVKGIFDPPPGGSPFGPVTISAAVWDANNADPKNLYSFVKMTGGEKTRTWPR